MPQARPTPFQVITSELGAAVFDFYVLQKAARNLEGFEGVRVLEQIAILHALYNNVVLALCRLADSKRGTWSFKRLVDVLEQQRAHNWRATVDPAIEAYYAAMTGSRACSAGPVSRTGRGSWSPWPTAARSTSAPIAC